MRHLILLAILGVIPIAWTNKAFSQQQDLPTGWQTQCFGRMQYDMPSRQARFNQDSEPPALYTDSQPTPNIWYGEYGRDPLHPEKVLVEISVSRNVSLDFLKRDTTYFRPSRGEAQQRVIQRELDDIKARKIALLSDQSQEADDLYSALRDQERALEQAYQHIGKVSTDIIWVSEAIEMFKAEGRDSTQLEAKLAELLIEDAKYPTDDLFEQEYFVDLQRPNALGISGPFDFSAKLWENGRIYTFQFGMEHGKPRSEQASLEPAALDFLSRFRSRAEHEIPDEPGVCIPFGFIADSGHEPFDFGYGWRPAGNRSIVYRIDQPASKELISMQLERLVPNPYPSMLSITNVGPDAVNFGYRQGTLVGIRTQARNRENPEQFIPETYHLVAEASARGPVPSVSMEFKTNREGGEFPPFDQAEAEFKRILQSFRPIPGIARLMNEETQSANEADESDD